MKKLLVLLACFSILAFVFNLKELYAETSPLYGYVEPDSLEITSVEFSADSYSKSNYDPFIRLGVYNNSPYNLVRAFIKFRITCDDGKREVFSERFVKFISGSMPAYSSAVWFFYPRNSSFWAMHNIPYDAKISATVEELHCPKQNTPWQYEFKHDYPSRHDMFY
ncbi:MAG: hypothetical protein Kow0029_09280 [Candidatus Rifleibacteriota bacterium]